MKRVLMILFLMLGLVGGVSGTTINALSCEQNDVQNAVNSASDGDTVLVPAGECVWASEVLVNKTLIIKGQTITTRNNLTYEVGVVDNTIIQSAGNGFRVAKSNGVRITGFSLRNMSVAVVMPSPVVGMRVDHCHFVSVRKIFDKSTAPTYKGILFDNNRVYEPAYEVLYVTGAGNDPWIENSECGVEDVEKMTIVENNEFVWSASGGDIGPIDSGNGAMVIFRYNRFSGDVNNKNSIGELFENHGHCWGQRDGNDNAGTYCTEIYNNKIYKGNRNSTGALLFKSRGGRSRVYNNEIFDAGFSTNSMVKFWTQEVSTQCNSAGCTSQEHQDMGLHIVPLNTSTNDEYYQGGFCIKYPCPMQVNNAYVWDNSWDSGNFAVYPDWGATGYVIEDRDYWDDIGVGDTNFVSGTSRPSTCLDDDVYWETDNKRLYRCDGDNNWIQVYETYTYPHPLSLSEIPEPPTQPSICGNNLTESGEICDGIDLNGQNCSTVNVSFVSGNLGCLANCLGYDVSGCVGGCLISDDDVDNKIQDWLDGKCSVFDVIVVIRQWVAGGKC